MVDFDNKNIYMSGFFQYMPRDNKNRKIKEWSGETFKNVTIEDAIKIAEGTDFEIPSLLDFYSMNRKDLDALGFVYNYHWCRESHVHTVSDEKDDSISTTFKAYVGYHSLFQYPVWRMTDSLLHLRMVKYE